MNSVFLLLPIADGTSKSTTLFEVEGKPAKAPTQVMKLSTMERMEGDVLWLKYGIG